jgi:putative MATE family efflux protein
MRNHHEKLGTDKIPGLLLRQSLPAMFGLLMISLYNVVDTIFIGQSVGTLGIAALTIAFPIQMIVISVAQTVGIGASSIISRSLGSNDQKTAENTLGNFLSINIALGIFVTIIGLVFLPTFLRIFGATDTILPYATEYMEVILYGTLFLCFTAGSNTIIRAEGNAKLAMYIMLLSTVTNVILDPIFIFGLDMGLRGAAIATVISQVVSGIFALHYFVSGKTSIKIHLKTLILKWKTIRSIFAIGSSALARQSAGATAQAILNNSLGFYGGDLAIAAFGLINKILMMIAMPMFGLLQGMQPILGFNYGARQPKRAKEVVIYAIKAATVFATIAFAILMIFIESITKIFTSDPELISLTTRATRIIILTLPFIGFQVIASGVYQSLGKAVRALIVSVLRQLIFLIPLILILPRYFGLDGIFYSMPIADLFAASIISVMLYRQIRRFDPSR